MKTTNLYWIICVIYSLSLFSCSSESEHESWNKEIDLEKDNIQGIEPLSSLRAFSKENGISEDYAIKIATSSFNNFEGYSLTKNTAQPRVKDVTILKVDHFPELKNTGIVNIPDTLAYIINFEGDLGYMIIAADRRLGSDVLAQSANSNLYYENVYADPHTAFIFEYLEGEIYGNLKETDFVKETIQEILDKETSDIAENLQTKYGIPMDEIPIVEMEVYKEDVTSYATKKQVGPLAHVEWGQGSPYNDLVKSNNCSSEESPVGCVPVMVSQIMSYYKYPSNIQGKNINWNILNEYTGKYSFFDKMSINYAPQSAKTMVAELMWGLGKETNAKYSCDGTGADYEGDGLKTLKRFGYNVDNVRDHDWRYVVNSLDNNKLVAANGKSKKGKTWIFFNKYSGGHAWVIDGYIVQEKKVRVIREYWNYYRNANRKEHLRTVEDIITESRTLLRMNWGWDGIGAGYYSLDSFDSNSPIVKSGEDGNYKYNKKVAAVYR